MVTDRYLETVVESAKELVSIRPRVQLYLAGIFPRPDDHLEYF